MVKRGDLKLRILIILALVISSFFYVFPLNKKINLGLDLKGGMYILLRADTSSISPAQVSDAINGAIEKIRSRIDTYGVKETSIQKQGKDSILVQVPGVVDREIVNNLRKVGKLEFKLVEVDKEKIEAALGGNVPEGYELKEYEDANLLLYSQASITGADLAESFVGFDSYGGALVSLRFTSGGARGFAKVTEESVGRRLAIVLDGRVMSAPAIREPISSGQAQIEGDFSLNEARALTSVLNSGALPLPLFVEEERSVGPLLGSDSIKRGVNSMVLGAALVAVFMLIYYLLGGVISIICLCLDLLFILAGLYLLRGTLTLPGIAGIILTLGMAVDANVLILERIREELTAKKPLFIAVKNGFDRAKRTIFDANITTLIAALFLFIYGTGPIRGFATTLSLGIVASIFTAVFVGRTILSLLLSLKLKKLPMLKFFSSSNINFVSLRNICIGISLIIISFSVFNFYSHKDRIYGVDFKGGQILEYKLTPPVDIERVRKSLKDDGYSQVIIQEFKDAAGGVTIKSKEDIADKVKKVLGKISDTVEELKITTVGPAVGKVLKKKAYLAVGLSLLGILFYVGFRFKHFDFAFAAVIALLHDCVISLGIFVYAGFEIDLLTITALLTIAGYSINDTIVIYDRIREISPRLHKLSLKEIVNLAINNTLSRTVITSFTTIMVVTSIYLLGGEALRGFSFILLVGFIAGTYSSIYIASPLVLLFRKPHRKI
ncbi:MAG: protein translocase subunit SecD [Candidatus Omnitrophica bacterium]|nr:protein translocase subunit SecD [Candidatus Omnitrophota bacterium]MBU1133542.1 protein translocase subunit SecD [Candidatus Omnitrophota bacterium]MBU1810054.1 protein translocase subunit SecD [Candidatus Omnitrophota bacterium]